VTGIKLEWHGADLLKMVRAEIPDALFEAADQLAKAAASKAPKASGDLARSAYAKSATRSTYASGKKHKRELAVKEGEAVAAFAAFYAKFVEVGTKNMAAKPFLRPAFDELRQSMGKNIVAKIGKRLSK
jgi:HK97 gp10 family phage protein